MSRTDPVTPATIQNQLLWNNCKIKINNAPIKKCLNVDFVGDLYDSEGLILSWRDFSRINNTPPDMWFKYKQIIDAIPNEWKIIINENKRVFL